MNPSGQQQYVNNYGQTIGQQVNQQIQAGQANINQAIYQQQQVLHQAMNQANQQIQNGMNMANYQMNQSFQYANQQMYQQNQQFQQQPQMNFGFPGTYQPPHFYNPNPWNQGYVAQPTNNMFGYQNNQMNQQNLNRGHKLRDRQNNKRNNRLFPNQQQSNQNNIYMNNNDNNNTITGYQNSDNYSHNNYSANPDKKQFRDNKKRDRYAQDIIKTQSLLEELFEGDVLKVQECLSNQQKLAEKLRTKTIENEKSVLKKKYPKQLDFLRNNGFKNTQKNIILLVKENGNEEAVLKQLVKEILENEIIKYRFCNELKQLEESLRSDEQMNYQGRQYQQEPMEIENQGYLQERKIWQVKKQRKILIQALCQAQGDIVLAKKLFNDWEILRKEEESRMTENLRILALEGWVNAGTKKKIIKILVDAKGNVTPMCRIEVEMKCCRRIKALTANEEMRLTSVKYEESFIDDLNVIILDGNNVLFVNSDIRKDCIQKNREAAERKICQLCKEFKEIILLNSFMVVFDQMRNSRPIETSVQVVNVENTEFTSADDYIVNYITNVDPTQAGKCMIITSDLELTHRIIQMQPQVKFMKGKVFFEKIEEILSKERVDSITKDPTL